MSFIEILQRYSYADDKNIIERIKSCSGKNERENRDIINSIVLWKINRQVDIGVELFNAFKKINVTFLSFETKEREIKAIIFDLLQVKGIKIAMASTILKMFYPEVFPIVDQRAYRELMGKELPVFYGASSTQKFVDLYYQYVKDCHTYNKNICPEIKFENVDKVLYQLDLEKGYKVKY
jgi:hypothetical protein